MPFLLTHPLKQAQYQRLEHLISSHKNTLKPSIKSNIMAIGFHYHIFVFSTLQNPFTPSTQSPRKARKLVNVVPNQLISSFSPFFSLHPNLNSHTHTIAKTHLVTHYIPLKKARSPSPHFCIPPICSIYNIKTPHFYFKNSLTNSVTFIEDMYILYILTEFVIEFQGCGCV